MFTVTSAAKEILTNALAQEDTDSGMLIRLYPAEENPERLEFGLDNEKNDDTVITSDDGDKIMVVQEKLADQLSEMMLDFQETDQGPGFVLQKASNA
jgi:Fe-S cluster assembly iron-binding protein IscA